MWAGILSFLAAQLVVAAGMSFRSELGVDGNFRAKTIAMVSGIALAASVTAWIITRLANRETVSRPALAVTGGLAASLLRLTVPLLVLAWLQLEETGNTLVPSQRRFMAETIVVSYLVLLFVDIVLNWISRPQKIFKKFGD